MKLKDVQSESDKNLISLSKLIGKKIKEVAGCISTEFGEPVFNMTKIVFEDGSYMWCEGEHDIAYLTNGAVDQENYTDEILTDLYKQQG